MSGAWLIVLSAVTLVGARWQTVRLTEDGDLAVSLQVLRQASPADSGWMALVFRNTGTKPLTVTDASYWMTGERDDRTGRTPGSGSLASGNTFDLFPDGSEAAPRAPLVLQPGGVCRVVDQVSDYNTALLGLPPREGWRIRALVYVSVRLAGRRHLETQQPGVPFAFEWLDPGAAGIAVMQARLRQLLRAPVQRPYHGYLLGAYLDMPAVAEGVTRAELLDGLRRRQGPFDGREVVAAHLGRRFPQNTPAPAPAKGSPKK